MYEVTAKYKPEDYKGMYNLKQMEKQHLKYWIIEYKGDTKKVAQTLQIAPQSVINKLTRHDLCEYL